MEEIRELLEDFIEFLRDSGEDAFYVFEETDDAINRFLKEREND